MGATIGVKVKRAPKSDVACDRAKTGRFYTDIALVNERRHVDKAHLACALAIPFDKGFDEAARRVYAHAGFGLGGRYPAQFHCRSR